MESKSDTVLPTQNQEQTQVSSEESKLKPEEEKPFSEMTFAEKLAKKLGIKNVMESDVLEDFMTEFT